MNEEFKVVFRYEGTEPKVLIRILLERAFANIYNQYCELVNPMYESWNKDYNEETCGAYEDYIRTKQQFIVDTMINPMLFKRIAENDGQSIIRRFLIGKECNFEAELEDGTIMQFYLKQV